MDSLTPVTSDQQLRAGMEDLRERDRARAEGRTVTERSRDDASREGWAHGVEGPRGRAGTFLVIPGSAVAPVVLHRTRGDAQAAADRRPDGPWEVRRVLAVWRYGRNWFRVLTDDESVVGAG